MTPLRKKRLRVLSELGSDGLLNCGNARIDLRDEAFKLYVQLLQFGLVETGLQHGHGSRAVLVLAAFLLAGDHDARRHVGDADGRVGGVHVLTTGARAHLGGTFVTIEGPRFSTKAESRAFRQLGFSIIGMTATPEAFLAREAEMSYATMAHITDFDVWHESETPVTVEMVIQTLLANTVLAKQAVENAIRRLATLGASPPTRRNPSPTTGSSSSRLPTTRPPSPHWPTWRSRASSSYESSAVQRNTRKP